MWWTIGVAAVLSALCWKTLPFVWHIRLLRVLLKPLFIRSKVFDPTEDGALLYRPRIQTSSCPISELDYNMHKSNSTFFTDLDIVRIDLLAQLFAGGLNKLGKSPAQGATNPKPVLPMLAGIHCNFRREVPPFGRYEMHTRVLCWDQKWLFVITHFVKPGKRQAVPVKQGEKTTRPLIDKDVLATAVTKYVFKAGRVTVPPDRVFEASGLIVPAGAVVDTRKGWDRTRIEEERLKGVHFMEAFGSLETTHSTFSR
ncbi:hypothetical protein K461DRAFT_43643 [Myriangium duriaei CBS 260.36]|uniref:Thioesterase n=1 Tax=Myriangium duriaei CBS 260.36 TaxID=1168546 RepID=A0A9P4IYU1_9PEZI|nr:hypothetical protein K461DRAFT_43643 [Myriangium duriaei CBS 260.36]